MYKNFQNYIKERGKKMLLLNCRIRETIRSKKPLAQSCSYCLIKHTPKKGGRRAGIVLTSYIWNNKTGFWYLACCPHTKRNRHPPRKKKKNNAFWDRLKGTHQRNFRVHRLLSCKDSLMLKKKRYTIQEPSVKQNILLDKISTGTFPRFYPFSCLPATVITKMQYIPSSRY